MGTENSAIPDKNQFGCFGYSWLFLRSVTVLILWLVLSIAHAEQQSGTNDSAVNNQAERETVEGEALWIEEKINPATRWIEKLVKPVTSWIEDKIQNHEDLPPTSQPDWQATQPAPQMNEWSPQAPERNDASVISPERAANIATRTYPGEVLRVKFLPKEIPVYRVKIISRKGEIHILYVSAWTGDILN